ncbi:MAG: hypothetical protein HKN76_13085 [Saprospiraceae bacterium]|nr:hypothetical protein [Saprospiraceae bacterium]
MLSFLIALTSLNLTYESDTLFRSIEAGFEVRVPGEMIHDIKQFQTEIGEINYHSFYYQSESDTSGSFVYVISYYDSPALKIPADSVTLIEEFFQSTVEQAAMSLAGEVLILDDISYRGKYPGKFWRLHYNGGRSVMKTKAFLVEGRFYSVQVAVEARFSLSDEIDNFMNSFKLINIKY